MITIRAMKAEDIPNIIELEKSCFTSDAWKEKDFEYRIAISQYVNLVAEADNRFAGYVACCLVAGELSIDSLAVSPKFRRTGIASALIKEAIEQKKPTDLYLEVRQSNYGAIALYESMGFETVGLRREYYQQPVENAILMTMRIEK